MRSLERRTLEVDFLPLAMVRSPPLAPTACAEALWPAFIGDGFPTGYHGARFIVSGARLQGRSLEDYDGLLRRLEAAPVAD